MAYNYDKVAQEEAVQIRNERYPEVKEEEYYEDDNQDINSPEACRARANAPFFKNRKSIKNMRFWGGY